MNAREKYERDARRMLAAIREWASSHDVGSLELCLPPQEIFLCAPLDSPVIELVARNATTRTFVAWIDERTHYQGTVRMFAACVRLAGLPSKEFEAGALYVMNLFPLSPGGSS